MSYVYIKQDQPSPKKRSSRSSRSLDPKVKKFLGSFFLLSGVGFFGFVIYPILRFQISYSLKFNRLASPLSVRFYNQSDNILGQVSNDYTQLKNWFVDQPNYQNTDSQAQSAPNYLLSIPELKIKDARVEIGSLDLKKSLIQYPQTALPGQLGNAVVFGHSVLPQFFNPKSYLTIFSTLYRLKQGDPIYLKFDNIDYKYLVEEMYEVQPTDLSVLEQRFDGRYLTLITCSPPGTYLRRLIVKARIVDI